MLHAPRLELTFHWSPLQARLLFWLSNDIEIYEDRIVFEGIAWRTVLTTR